MQTRIVVTVWFLAVALTTLAVTAAGQEPEPVNPNATAEVRQVLSYLQSIQGEKVLSGHHVVYGRMQERDLSYLLDTTGKHPAIIEFEGGVFARKYTDDYASVQDQIVADATAHWKEGGLVAVCWHWGNPLEPINTYENTKLKFDIEAALTEGTPEHQAFIKDLDAMANMLDELQQADVPVLFRPLHEICGGWFWWGMEGKERAQELWKFIYDYYTERHQLNNLIWVYSASQEMRTDWFPGLAYADVVGVDIYRQGEQDERRSFDRMHAVAGSKPVALTECDVIPDPDVMRERGFLWNWVTTWHSRYLRQNSAEVLKRFYQHELVITRDELPDW